MSTIHEVFETRAHRFPSHIAVKFGEETLTYAELSKQSDLFAGYLQRHHCKVGGVVAVMMGRSIDMIVSILAILKTGGVYLPLDPDNPVERNQRCLNEADVRVIISDSTIHSELTETRTLIQGDVYKSLSTSANTYQPTPIELHADSPCYIVYTSGSTGNPKGVIAPHRGVLRLVIDPDYIKLSESDSILQFAPLSFDAATFEIWGALLNGGTLILYSGTSLDPNLLASELKENQVTILFITTALFHIVASHFMDALSPLKYLLTGGDVLNPDLINKVADTFPKLNLLACYGPTENTTFTSTHPIKENSRPVENVPIGRAISGSRMYILDSNFKPLPQGEIGELFVSGLGVALGYVNRDKSRQDFFEDASIDVGMIYRTGDLARMNANYDIEFLGRTDNQVKIRGFRASLEEIQSTIMRLTVVEESAVMLEKFDCGDQILVAYVQLKNSADTSVKQLKQLLSETLPDYLIPNRLHINTAFPINKNGKVCKKSLRAMNEKY